MTAASLVPARLARLYRGVASVLAVGLLTALAACSGGTRHASAPVPSAPGPSVSPSVSPSASPSASPSPTAAATRARRPARHGLAPVAVAGYRYGTVSDLSSLAPAPSGTAGLLGSVRAYTVNQGGRPVAVLGLYSLAPRARTPAGRYRVLTALLHATDPEADVWDDRLGSIELRSIVDARGSGMDFYAWSAGAETGFAFGPNGVRVLTFVIGYLRAAYPHAAAG
jgi:hypothetical protein